MSADLWPVLWRWAYAASKTRSAIVDAMAIVQSYGQEGTEHIKAASGRSAAGGQWQQRAALSESLQEWTEVGMGWVWVCACGAREGEMRVCQWWDWGGVCGGRRVEHAGGGWASGGGSQLRR